MGTSRGVPVFDSCYLGWASGDTVLADYVVEVGGTSLAAASVVSSGSVGTPLPVVPGENDNII